MKSNPVSAAIVTGEWTSSIDINHVRKIEEDLMVFSMNLYLLGASLWCTLHSRST